MADIRFLTPITILSNVGGINIDITRKRGEVYENIITQNPVENGSPTSDHIVNLPVKVTMEGGFTDTPTTSLVGPALSNLSLKGRSKDLFDQLLKLNVTKETFDIMDGLHLFKDMFFKNITETKEREGFFVNFTMELWRIIKIKIDKSPVNFA
ncbi:hypothetical protein KAR91_05030, partial [Candidatus Pacearchaeota archaeon]|nr:hypothetical protein [Candidatus Pacearchaeota archaeon]